MNQQQEEQIRKEVSLSMKRVGLRYFVVNSDIYWKKLSDVLKRLEVEGIEKEGYAEEIIKQMKTEVYGTVAPLINSPQKIKQYLQKALNLKQVRKIKNALKNPEQTEPQ